MNIDYDRAVARRVHALVSYLTGEGVLGAGQDSIMWAAGLESVPRHRFVPARAWAEPMDNRPEHLIDRDADPDRWWDAVYSNTAIITQRADGDADVDDSSALPTSSLSCPHVSVEFLRLLGVDQHHRVLEIGTGTGWSAAMLAWRLGDDQVVTVEVDQQVAAQAALNLRTADPGPLLVVGDGAHGYADAAPYDRVHVTCGVHDIPHAWVEQTRPGGVIVAPYMPPGARWGQQLRLDVLDDGTAVGRFHGGASYMMLRSQRPRRWEPAEDEGVTSTSRLDPRTVARDLRQGLELYLHTVVPRLAIIGSGWDSDENGKRAWAMRLREAAGDGWALATTSPDNPDTHVLQGGERALWDELQAAYMGWLRVGRPGSDRLGVTVTPAGQSVWLDSPSQPLGSG